jgi:hypothetical protein
MQNVAAYVKFTPPSPSADFGDVHAQYTWVYKVITEDFDYTGAGTPTWNTAPSVSNL